LWIAGGLSGACLLVWLSYQCRLGSRAGIGKLCGQSSPPAGRILLTAKVGSLAIITAIRRVLAEQLGCGWFGLLVRLHLFALENHP